LNKEGGNAVLHLDLPLCFFLGLTAWLDFGLRDVTGFGELDMALHEWPTNEQSVNVNDASYQHLY